MQKFMQTLKNKKDSMLESIKNREGFTLIELIVVMAIIAILVLLAAPRFLGYTKDAQLSAIQQDVKVLSDAALQYNIENDGAWPEGTETVTAPTALSTVVTDEDLVSLDGEELSQYVKSISNDLEDYALVTADGSNEGEVIFVGNNGEGFTNREGDEVHYGISDEFVLDVAPAE